MKVIIRSLIFIVLYTFVYSDKATKNILCENVKNIEDATDCFNTILDDDYETCCFFEFKKKNEYVRERYCKPLDLQQYLNISDTIEEIKKDNKGIKIYSLECDKNNYLTTSIFILISLFLILF